MNASESQFIPESHRRSQTAATSLKIAAVFATMNRAPTVIACVRALAAQSRPPELVVVADNASADDTVAALESLHGLPFELIVRRLPENRGNAGGVEESMEFAFSCGADAVWILDDDSWPRPEALEALVEPPWNPRIVRHSLQIDPMTGCFTWPLQIQTGNGVFKLVERMVELPDGDFVRSRIMWTGALVSREVRDAVGRVNAGLFIRGEDEEYPWRIEQAGFPQEAVRKSILDHPGPADLVKWTLLGKRLFFERGLSDWKLYYKVRNMVWLKLRQSGWMAAVLMALAYGAAVARFDGMHRLPLVWTAARDGLVGRLGKWEKH